MKQVSPTTAAGIVVGVVVVLVGGFFLWSRPKVGETPSTEQQRLKQDYQDRYNRMRNAPGAASGDTSQGKQDYYKERRRQQGGG